MLAYLNDLNVVVSRKRCYSISHCYRLKIFEAIYETFCLWCVAEVARKEVDVISVPNKDQIVVHEPKLKVDLTKFLENQHFRFDYAFDETCSNELVYKWEQLPFNVYGSVYRKYILLYIYPTRCNITQFIYIWKVLYMFLVVPPPIIRNTYIYSIWYLSHHNCYLPLS